MGSLEKSKNKGTMGGCGSKAAAEENAKNKNIDVALKKENKSNVQAIKLLLLGAGDSGKSTIFKQVRILHQAGFTDDDRTKYKAIIHQNVWENIQSLLTACETLEIPLEPHLQDCAVFVLNHLENKATLDAIVASRIEELWQSAAVQAAYKERSKFQLYDSAQYFFEGLDRVSSASYVPNQEDILRARVRTSGIVNTEFFMEGVKFVMFDVGGQRNERRKWIHCFDNVHAVLFVVAISEYDQTLFEDHTINRLVESYNLFGEIVNSRFFKSTAMILFLNKSDLFAQKIRDSNITLAFPEYTGRQDFQEASRFIQNKFESAREKLDQPIYTHITCATDTTNMQFVLGAVKDIMFELNLKASGFF
eukprot:c38919_g1_i1.p1 GENE.c38919_g1_i1~~c38919_g1_i1.p1  ORF type:complete len:363 (+),score=105.05 c38919_g1_i1:1-1089(+)